jgi:hypothetical protein
MRVSTKLMPAMLVAAVALPVLVGVAAMPPEVSDIQNAVNAGFTPAEWQKMTLKGMTSSILEGRPVMRMNGQSLGYILAVNDLGRLVELQTPDDRAISLPESALRVEGGTVYVTQMGQRGRTAAVNSKLRQAGSRG